MRYFTIAVGGFILGLVTLWGVLATYGANRREGQQTTHEPYVFSITFARPESIDPDRWLQVVEAAQHRSKVQLEKEAKDSTSIELVISPRKTCIDVVVFAGDTDRSRKNAISAVVAAAMEIEQFNAQRGASEGK